MNFTEFRKNLASHIDRVIDDRAELVITRQNKESVVLVAESDWESMKETLYLLSNPANREHVLKSIAQADAGQVVERTLIEP